MRIRHIERALLVLAMFASSFQLAGCAEVASKRVISAEKKESVAATGRLTELSASEVAALAGVLTGEVQTVYPADGNLARVFGQVGNLGEKPYAAVRFDLVAEVPGKDGESTVEKVVGSFLVEDGLASGDIKPFDVQTTAGMGEVRTLRVKAAAVR